MYREVDHLIIGAGTTGMHLAKLLLDPQSSEKNKQVLVVDEDFSQVSMRLRPSQIRTLPFQLMEKAQDTSRLFASESQSFSPFHAVSSYLLQTLGEMKLAEQKKSATLATLRALGAGTIEGKAKLVDSRTVKVQACSKELVLKAKKIYLALGSKESAPTITGLSPSHYLFPSDLLQLKKIPRSWIVVGGTALGCVLAQSFSALGISTTLIEPGPKLLDHSFAENMRDKMKEDLVASNVLVKTACRLQEAELFPDVSSFLSPGKTASKEAPKENSRENPLEPGQLLIESGGGQLSWHHGQAILFACQRRARYDAAKDLPFLRIDHRFGIHTNAQTGICLHANGEEIDGLFAFGSCTLPLVQKPSLFPARLLPSPKTLESKEKILLRRNAAVKRLQKQLLHPIPALPSPAMPSKRALLPRIVAGSRQLLRSLLQPKTMRPIEAAAHTLFIPTAPPLLQITSEKFLSFLPDQKGPSLTIQVPVGPALEDQLVIAGGEKQSLENSVFSQSGYMAEIICSKAKGEIWKITMICPQAQEIACSLQQAISTGITLEEICRTQLVSYTPERLFEQALLQYKCLKRGTFPID